jgi:hypothetical protein
MGTRKKKCESVVSGPDLSADPKSRDEMRALAERTGGVFVPGQDHMQPFEDSIQYSAGTRVPEVREVAGARELVTIGPEHPAWSERETIGLGPLANGCIARVQPPVDATDSVVEHMVFRLKSDGAAVVRVLPRRKSRVLTAPRERVAHEGARVVVLALVREANVEDREALAAFVEGVMERQKI